MDSVVRMMHLNDVFEQETIRRYWNFFFMHYDMDMFVSGMGNFDEIIKMDGWKKWCSNFV